MRKLLWLLIFLLTVSSGIAVYNWRHPSAKFPEAEPMEGKKAGEEQAQVLAQLLLNQGRPLEALRTIRSYDEFISSATPQGRRWMQLLIEASTKLSDGAQLGILWEYFPQAFDNNEEAVIVLARHMIAGGRTDDYKILRKKWQGKETLKDDWFFLDADAISARSEPQEAIYFLESQKLEGKIDSDRLLRIAAEEVKLNDSQKAWKYLTEAVAINPENPLVHIYRARFLEALGKADHALAEYATVVQLAPKSLMFKDQLVDFFLRHERYTDALNVLKTMLINPTTDFVWVKTFFWNKVALPINFDWKKEAIPEGSFDPLLKYLISLPKDTFWDENRFNFVVDGNRYLKSSQATLWLRLIQFLIDKKEKEARELLQNDLFTKYSFHPRLEKALQQILIYRLDSMLASKKPAPNSTEEELQKNLLIGQKNPFFDDLNEADAKGQIPKSLESLLRSEEVFAAAFLAARWDQAAIALHRVEVYPEEFPSWMPLYMGYALFANEGSEKALEFLNRQKPKNEITLLKGEIFLADQKYDEAIPILLSIKEAEGATGQEAVLQLAQVYLMKNKSKEAEEILKGRTDLANNIRGEETFARLALENHEPEKAEALYKKIIENSIEAKSYFARKAFQEKNLKEARRLTVELLQKNPENQVLRNNLEEILQREGKEKTSHE